MVYRPYPSSYAVLPDCIDFSCTNQGMIDFDEEVSALVRCHRLDLHHLQNIAFGISWTLLAPSFLAFLALVTYRDLLRAFAVALLLALQIVVVMAYYTNSKLPYALVACFTVSIWTNRHFIGLCALGVRFHMAVTRRRLSACSVLPHRRPAPCSRCSLQYVSTGSGPNHRHVTGSAATSGEDDAYSTRLHACALLGATRPPGRARLVADHVGI